MLARTLLLAGAVLAAARAAVPRVFSSTATTQPANASVAAAKSTYAASESVTVVWNGMPAGSLQIWFEAPDAPVSIVPHGPMHFASGPAGRWTLAALPSGRTWEIRYTGVGGPQRGGQFAVGASSPATRARVGHYGCYTTTFTGLTRSSIQWVDLLAGNRYREPRGQGAYTVDPATASVHMTTGPLAGRVAHVEATGTGSPGLYFAREENLDHGRPTIDVSSTMCGLGQK